MTNRALLSIGNSIFLVIEVIVGFENIIDKDAK